MRSIPTYNVRFQVTRPLMAEGQTAETTVRLKAPTTDAAVKLARFKLEAKGWTVGKCTAIWTKLQHHWVNPAY